MKKLILSVITIAILLFGLNMISASAANVATGTCGENLTWTLDDAGTLTITGTGAMYEYTMDTNEAPWFSSKHKIKQLIIEDDVSTIGSWAFYNCNYLTSVTIGDGVTTIGNESFIRCSNLTNVEIGNSVQVISIFAFQGCSKLSSITFPNSVTTIGSDAFRGCTNLAELTIGDGVTYIGSSAFSECISLEEVIIADGVTTINDYAFSDCTNLTKVTIGNNVTTIGDGVFVGCTKLDCIKSTGTSRQWSNIKIGDSNTALENVVFEKHIIEYNLNSGEGSFPEQIKTNGVDITLHNTIPQREGYVFNGWSTTLEGDVEYLQGDTFSLDSDTVLYAKWEANTYTISYNATGGVGAMASSTHIYDVYGILNTNTFTKTGYTFKGWATSPSGNVVYNDGDNVINLSSEPNGNVNLYAVWEANTYTITYYANGGDGEEIISVHTYGIEKMLNKNVFSKVGHTFQGWATHPTGEIVYKDGDKVSNLEITAGGNINLYAIWQVNTYTISYNTNGGNGTMTASTFTYDVSGTLKSNTFTKTGYTFKGWATSPTGMIAYNDCESIANLTSDANANVNLYAIWKANTYTISYNANGGTGNMASSSHTYDVPYKLNENMFIKTGYTFDGWAITQNGRVVYDDRQTIANLTSEENGNVILYAVWKIITYTVTYDANGGSDVPEAQTKTYGTDILLREETPIKTGYTFKGWATTPDGSAGYVSGERFSLNSDTVLYAVWELNTYTITYDANGGSGSMGASVHQYNTPKYLNANRFGKTGYEFVGWDDAPTGAGKYVDGEEVNNLTADQNGEITLYAIWKANEYTISYNANGGSGIVRASNHIYDQTLNLNDNNFIRIGYIFRGWSKSTSGPVGYTDKQSVANLTPINNDNITLYAVWEPGCELYVNGNMVKFESQQPIYGKIIIALYSKDGKMKEMQPYDAVDGIDVTFSNISAGDYAKVLCWESITSAKPMFEAQTIILK